MVGMVAFIGGSCIFFIILLDGYNVSIIPISFQPSTLLAQQRPYCERNLDPWSVTPSEMFSQRPESMTAVWSLVICFSLFLVTKRPGHVYVFSFNKGYLFMLKGKR